MRRILAAVALVFALLTQSQPAQAQTVQTGDCAPGVPNASDLAGTYFSPESAMQVTLFPCGIDVLWSNAAGTHRAEYVVSGRLPDGSVLARISRPDPYVGTLDGRIGFGFSPAEPGWVKLLTLGPFGDNIRVYRLQRI